MRAVWPTVGQLTLKTKMFCNCRKCPVAISIDRLLDQFYIHDLNMNFSRLMSDGGKVGSVRKHGWVRMNRLLPLPGLPYAAHDRGG